MDKFYVGKAMQNFTRILVSFFLYFASTQVSAEIVELETAEKRTAQASFLQGDNDANPILILHGFLQTREFPTVERLANSLNESGYTVLTPTLTLGLSRRKQSLACEAIHTHTVQKDTDEIARWVDWLHKETGKKVRLVGHSAGSITLLNYLDTYKKENIENAIFISMSYFSESPGSYESVEHAQLAKAEVAKGYNPMGNYALSYCKLYPTTAKAFLSYYEWNRQKVAQLAATHADMIKVIIGTGDKRIDADWKDQLKQNMVSVTAVEGANHFFDQAHEFDLLEAIEGLLDLG